MHGDREHTWHQSFIGNVCPTRGMQYSTTNQESFRSMMFMPRVHYVMVLFVVALLAVVFAWFSCVPMSRRSNPKKFGPGSANSSSSISKFSSTVHGQKRSGLSSCFDQSTSQPTIKPLEMIMQTPWAPKLQKILANMTFSGSPVNLQQPRRQVTVVFGDAQQHESSLFVINWLVSALVMTSPPLKNVIVISLDEKLQTLLGKKDIASVHVEPETVTCGRIKRKVSRVWITRCVVYMLLNHWGYDVMAYDTDAIVLRNLQDILDTFGGSDIIGSAGGYPRNLVAEWGQTLCMGAVLFKSTTKTERLWNALSQSGGNLHRFDDQIAINKILYKCDIKWLNANSSSQLQVISGQCAESEDKLSGLKVTILPTSVICRKCYGEHKSGIYVWHKRAKKTVSAKMKAAVTTGTWYLKNTTETFIMTENAKLKGVDWIRALAKL